eukprot:s1120_g20.t1
MGLVSEFRDLAFIGVFGPEKKCMQYFQCRVLAFGAVRSVHSFLRLARTISWLGVVGCQLLWTSFCDDFISYSQSLLAKSTEGIATLFNILGWKFAEEGDKCMPFSDVCDVLFVSCNLGSSFRRGFATICNTEARIKKLCAELQLVIGDGELFNKDAQRLRGRVQFADAQLFGRTGKRCLRVLSDFAEGGRRKLMSKDVFFLGIRPVNMPKRPSTCQGVISQCQTSSVNMPKRRFAI